MTPPPRLLHLGNLLVDVVLTVPALPERGADVLAARSDSSAGGGFNVMAAAARQGLRVAYGGAHGSGPFGELARAACTQEGIVLVQPPKTGLDTGFVITMVDADGERTFVTSRGAEATLTADDLAPVQADPGDAIYLSGYSFVHPANRSALLTWLERVHDGQPVVFDPGPLVPSIPSHVLDTVLSRADWLTCNLREATLLTDSPDPLAAVAALTQRTGGAGVLVRTGPDGCLLGRPGSEPVHVPGFRVNVLDTNGAGDTHTGTFIAALAGGADVIEAVRRANAAAALSVTRRGPATAPTREELAASRLLDSRS